MDNTATSTRGADADEVDEVDYQPQCREADEAEHQRRLQEEDDVSDLTTASRGEVITYSVDLSFDMLQIMDAVNMTATIASDLNAHDIANELRNLARLIRTNGMSIHRVPIQTVIHSVEHVICTKYDGTYRALFAGFPEIVKGCRSGCRG